ncbi:MAG: ABC transporter ATP-binding protein [Polyangiaceae bacterium]|jgi:ABC-2 type transport system ATP-binding protein|nr:ABC transporter ATP-binding protein [Polyangiaceae bacterium]
MDAIEFEGVRKTYGGKAALDGLNLRVGPGEVFALLGSNGAGKSTALRVLLGFTMPTAGRASVLGVDCAADPLGVRRRAAYVPEQVALYPSLTGLETLRYLLQLGGLSPPEAELLAACEAVGLGREAAVRPVGTYSKGMRQKVALALAVARKSDVLLLDEPTSGLDPQAANELSAAVRRLSEGGAAVLMATHDIFRAREDARRVGILRQGRLVRVLETADVRAVELERIYLEDMRS